MKAFVFPGQGSQVKGMGEGLFERYPDIVGQADEILGYSIRELCLQDPEEKLGNTQYTQPALFVVNALFYMRRMDEGEAKPDVVAGHSLGEYNALWASGVFDFSTALRLVKRRGELMAEMREGGMAAVIGVDADRIREIIEEKDLGALDIANLNGPAQIVVSGPKDVIENAKEAFEDAGVRLYWVLPVGGAFHSRYMEPAKKSLETSLNDCTVGSLDIPVIANVTAEPYESDEIKRLLAEQLVKPVRWTETIQHFLRDGIEDIVEVGPGEVLTKMTGYIKKAHRR